MPEQKVGNQPCGNQADGHPNGCVGPRDLTGRPLRLAGDSVPVLRSVDQVLYLLGPEAGRFAKELDGLDRVFPVDCGLDVGRQWLARGAREALCDMMAKSDGAVTLPAAA